MAKFRDELNKELPELIKKGVLDTGTADKLRAYYADRDSGAKKKLAVFAFAILGSLLVGAGLILITAHNWDKLPRFVRVLNAFIPLLLSQAGAFYILFKNKQSVALREGVSVVYAASIGLSIAVISQVYNIGGDIESFILAWCLLGLPMIYLLDAITPAVLYMFGLVAWAGWSRMDNGTAVFFWPLFFLMIPFYINKLKTAEAGQGVRILTLALCIAVFSGAGTSLEKVIPGMWIILYTSLLPVFYMMGRLYAYKFPEAKRVFELIGFSGMIVLGSMLTFAWPWRDIGWVHSRSAYGYHGEFAFVDLLVCTVTFACALMLSLEAVRKKDIKSIAAASFWIFGLAGYFISMDMASPAQALFNIFLLGMGVVMIADGVKKLKLKTVNSGMFIVVLLIIMRFFDVDMDFTFRGILFMTLGIIFIAVNVYLKKRREGK